MVIDGRSPHCRLRKDYNSSDSVEMGLNFFKKHGLPQQADAYGLLITYSSVGNQLSIIAMWTELPERI